jgi:predicted nucleotidyltransferase
MVSATRIFLLEMPTTSLRSLAHHLDVPERTLRRAAAQGLVRGERTSARRFETSLREEAYLRQHWPLLRALRSTLRTEPSVRLAVLFGSLATGHGHEHSDVDLLVTLADSSAVRVAELTGRLEEQLGRDVQLVRLQDAESSPLLMHEVLERGRVLVDRDGQWPQLRSKLAVWRRRAAKAEPSLLDAMESLDDVAPG